MRVGVDTASPASLRALWRLCMGHNSSDRLAKQLKATPVAVWRIGRWAITLAYSYRRRGLEARRAEMLAQTYHAEVEQWLKKL